MFPPVILILFFIVIINVEVIIDPTIVPHHYQRLCRRNGVPSHLTSFSVKTNCLYVHFVFG